MDMKGKTVLVVGVGSVLTDKIYKSVDEINIAIVEAKNKPIVEQSIPIKRIDIDLPNIIDYTIDDYSKQNKKGKGSKKNKRNWKY